MYAVIDVIQELSTLSVVCGAGVDRRTDLEHSKC